MSDVETTIRSGTDLLADPAWEDMVANAGSVFHSGRFLLPWWRDRTRKQPDSQLVAATFTDGPDIVGGCLFELHDGLLTFAGGQDVVDYMGPASVSGREKDVAAAVTRLVFDDLAAEPGWRRLRLGGLVADDVVGQELIAAFTQRESATRVELYDRAPKIDDAPKGYLALLNAKRRAEILRKRSRLAEAVGEVTLVTSTADDWRPAAERLLAWKAATTPAMRTFVAEYGDFVYDMLATLAPAGAAQVAELCAGQRRLASAIVLSHRRTRYLYNMSYDQSLTQASRASLAPGVVLVSHLTEQALDAGWQFDFLKGAQDYKLRLGGVPRDMVVMTVER